MCNEKIINIGFQEKLIIEGKFVFRYNFGCRSTKVNLHYILYQVLFIRLIIGFQKN